MFNVIDRRSSCLSWRREPVRTVRRPNPFWPDPTATTSSLHPPLRCCSSHRILIFPCSNSQPPLLSDRALEEGRIVSLIDYRSPTMHHIARVVVQTDRTIPPLVLPPIPPPKTLILDPPLLLVLHQTTQIHPPVSNRLPS